MLDSVKKAPKQEDVVDYLRNLRMQFLVEVEKGRDPEEVSDSLSKQVVLFGVDAASCAAMGMTGTSIAASTTATTTASVAMCEGFKAAAPGPISLVVAGAVFSA